MSEQKHTPGKWKVVYATKGAFQVEDEDGAVLCARNYWDNRAAESEANARLISAAPELLESLKKVTAALVAVTSTVIRAEDMKKRPSKALASDTMFNMMLKDYDDATFKAREVIAKAEKKSNS